jgi:transposase
MIGWYILIEDIYKLQSSKHVFHSFEMDIPQNIRDKVVAHHAEGNSCRQIASMLQIPKSSVNNIVRRYSRCGFSNVIRIGRCGRPRKVSIRDERAIARQSVKNPLATARQIRGSVGGQVSTLSISTVNRALKRQGRKAYRPSKSPSLNYSQRMVRLQW